MNTPSRNPSTETGQVPRYEPVAPKPREPMQPATLPELDEPQGTTGIVQIVSEGLDDSKDADDPIKVRKR